MQQKPNGPRKILQPSGALSLLQSSTARIFGQGFANRVFGPVQLVQTNTPVQPLLIGGPATYPDVNLLRFIQEAYSGNATVYTIIAMVARKFGSIPRYVYEVNDQKSMRNYRNYMKHGAHDTARLRKLELKAYDETVVDDSPLANLLNHPNDGQGQDTFYETLCLFYMLGGESFIWLNRGDIDGLDDDTIDKIPAVEMQWLPPQYVDLIPDPTDVWGVVGYYLNVNGQRIFLRKNDVIHWRRPNPNFDASTRVHQRGFSPLNAGNKLVTQDESATDASVAMHQNDGARGALFNETLSDLSPEQATTLRNVMNNKVNNRDIKGTIAALQGKWGYLNFGMSSVDMELVEGQQAIFVKVCNLFGVNAMMFLTDTTYANIQQARKDLVTGLVLPMCCSLRDEMNRVLLPAFGLSPKSVTHDIDPSQLPELQNDMAQLVTSLSVAWWLTPNDRRKAMNEEPLDEDEMDKIWIPNNLVLMEDAAMTDTLNSFTDGPGEDQGAGGTQNSDILGNDPGKGNDQGLPAKAPKQGKS